MHHIPTKCIGAVAALEQRKRNMYRMTVSIAASTSSTFILIFPIRSSILDFQLGHPRIPGIRRPTHCVLGLNICAQSC